MKMQPATQLDSGDCSRLHGRHTFLKPPKPPQKIVSGYASFNYQVYLSRLSREGRPLLKTTAEKTPSRWLATHHNLTPVTFSYTRSIKNPTFWLASYRNLTRSTSYGSHFHAPVIYMGTPTLCPLMVYRVR